MDRVRVSIRLSEEEDTPNRIRISEVKVVNELSGALVVGLSV